MKRMRKALSLLLCLALVFGAAPLAGLVGLELPGLASLFETKAAAYGESGTSGELTWQWVMVSGRGPTLGFSGSGAMADYASAADTPYAAYLNDAINSSRILVSLSRQSTVTHIGDYAFADFPKPISLDGLPSSLTSIGDYAFDGSTLTGTLTIPTSVTSIGAWYSDASNPPAAIAVNYAGTPRDWAMIDMPAETRAYLNQNLTTAVSDTYTWGDLYYDVGINGEITIVGFAENAESEFVPDEIDGLPVTAIRDFVLMNTPTLTELYLDVPLKSIGELMLSYSNPSPASVHVTYFGGRAQWANIQMSQATRTYLEQNITFFGFDVGDVIEYGRYPQSMVTDTDLIYALNEIDPYDVNWDSLGYYAAGIHGGMTPTDAIRYTDVNYHGEMYRGVIFNDYKASNTWEDSGDNFTVPFVPTLNTVYWFKYEPLRWRVLDPDEGLVICESIIDARAYNDYLTLDRYWYYGDAAKTYLASNYIESSIRAWLNDDFYNTAFNAAEQSNMLAATLNNECSMTLSGSDNFHDFDLPETNDQVFLLDFKTVDDGANSYLAGGGAVAQGTDYAVAQGLYYNENGNGAYWWLRTPGINDGQDASWVDFNGQADIYLTVTSACTGIRPVIKLEEVVNEYIENYVYDPLVLSGNEMVGLYVVGCDPTYQGEVVIPSAEDLGVPIIGIEAGAFSNCTGVTAVSIPATVNTIGEWYEGNTAPASIHVNFTGSAAQWADIQMSQTTRDYLEQDLTVDPSVTIGQYRVVLRSDVTGDEYSIVSCDDTVTGSVVLPAELNGIPVTKLESSIFAENPGAVTGVTIPASITKIEPGVFLLCSNIETITVDANNTTYCGVNNCVIDKTYPSSKVLVAGCKNSVIPADFNIREIGQQAFVTCSGLTEIVVPAGVNRIASGAFLGCTGLSDVTLPNTLYYIDYLAFSQTISLTSLMIPGSVLSIDEWMIETEYSNPQPASIAIVYDNTPSAWSGCTMSANTRSYLSQNITFTAPDTYTDGILVYKNNNNSYLSVQKIANNVSANEIRIPSEYEGLPVTRIEPGAFGNYTMLTQLTIPASIESIGLWYSGSIPASIKVDYLGSKTEWDEISMDTVLTRPYLEQRLVVVYAPGDLFEFGSYPQTKVTNSMIKSRLNGAANNATWTNYQYYSGTSQNNEFNGAMNTNTKIMEYTDVVDSTSGAKYRGVRIYYLRPEYTGNRIGVSSQQNGNGYYSYGTSEIFWFKFEPLTWRLLDPNTGYMMCTTAIDSQPYQNFMLRSGDTVYGDAGCTTAANSYVNSSIRAWLNNDFYNTAFTAAEKAKIQPHQISNASNRDMLTGTTGDPASYADTTDAVFLLSVADIADPYNGLGDTGRTYDPNDLMRASNASVTSSDYALCQGLYKSGDMFFWWLRTASTGSTFLPVEMANMYNSSNTTVNAANCTSVGVVPALYMTMPELPEVLIDANKNYIVGTSLSLNGDLTVNIYIEPSDDVIESGYVLVQGPNNYNEIIKVSDLRHNDNGYKISVPVYSPQMTETITVRVFDFRMQIYPLYIPGTDSYYTSYNYDTSVDAYLQAATTHSNQHLRELAASLNNYGAYAQIQFNHELTMTPDPALLESVTANDVEAYTLEFGGAAAPSATFDRDVKMSLLLKDTTSLRIYFRVTDGMSIPTVILDGDTANPLTPVDAGANYYYYVTIPDIKAPYLGLTHTLSFDGHEIYVSPLTYVYNVLNEHSDMVALCNVCKALYLYYVAAAAMFL